MDNNQNTTVEVSLNLYNFFNHGAEPLVLAFILKRFPEVVNSGGGIWGLNRIITEATGIEPRYVTKIMTNLERCGILLRKSNAGCTTVKIDMTFPAMLNNLPPKKVMKMTACNEVAGFKCPIPAIEYHMANMGYPVTGYRLETEYTDRWQPKYTLVRA